MRSLGVMLTCAFLLAGTSLAGPAEGNLPGVGTFAYNGTPVAGAVHHALAIGAGSSATE